MNELRNRQQPDPHKRTGRPNPEIDPKNPWNKPAQKVQESTSEKRNPEPEISNEAAQENTPSGESRRPITNQDEQRKATNVDNNNISNDEGTI
jgi:hypothetical protein